MDRNVYVSDFNKWAVNFGSTSGMETLGCQFTDSRDGHVYVCTTIGTQVWMAENLGYLPSVNTYPSYSSATSYYYVYEYNGTSVSEAKATANYGTYGVLYNWPAAMAACPSGWHLPTDEEWKILEKNQGMTESDADATIWRNSGTVGGKLKETGTSHWYSSNTGVTNSSGFTALPGGYYNSGGFLLLGPRAFFWTASGNGASNIWYRALYAEYAGVYRNNYDRGIAMSVRCLQNN